MSEGDSHIKGMVMLVLNFELNRFIKEINLGVAQALRKRLCRRIVRVRLSTITLMGKYIGFSY